jgi:hypothetical protein
LHRVESGGWQLAARRGRNGLMECWDFQRPAGKANACRPDLRAVHPKRPAHRQLKKARARLGINETYELHVIGAFYAAYSWFI